VDVTIQTTVTEHQTLKVKCCPYGNGQIAGMFPENVRAYVQYGDSITIAVGLLNTYGAVSVERIHSLMKSHPGISLSTGTIISMVKKCAEKVQSVNEAIRIMMRQKMYAISMKPVFGSMENCIGFIMHLPRSSLIRRSIRNEARKALTIMA